jgi:hypothetical protein
LIHQLRITLNTQRRAAEGDQSPTPSQPEPIRSGWG